MNLVELYFEKVASVSYAIWSNKITDFSYKNINIETGAYPQNIDSNQKKSANYMTL